MSELRKGQIEVLTLTGQFMKIALPVIFSSSFKNSTNVCTYMGLLYTKVRADLVQFSKCVVIFIVVSVAPEPVCSPLADTVWQWEARQQSCISPLTRKTLMPRPICILQAVLTWDYMRSNFALLKLLIWITDIAWVTLSHSYLLLDLSHSFCKR